MRNGTIVMGPSGDRAISWDDADSEKMISYIQSKMDAGWMFFIVERGSIERWKPLKSAEDARATKSVVMVEPELAAAVETGVALVSEAKGATIDTSGRAKTAEEVAANDTVAVRPARGG